MQRLSRTRPSQLHKTQQARLANRLRLSGIAQRRGLKLLRTRQRLSLTVQSRVQKRLKTEQRLVLTGQSRA